MKKNIIYLSFIFIGCKSLTMVSQTTTESNNIDLTLIEGDSLKVLPTYIKTITEAELKEMLYVYAGDDMEGRKTGSEGQHKASEYLRNYYKALGLKSGIKNGDYFQSIPSSMFDESEEVLKTENVLAFIEGAEIPEEIIVISAHLDHLGSKKNGKIYNGADDNGSGTIALLEIAEAFKMAIEEGNRPKRSILFLHFTAEEIKMQGSRYFTENPTHPLENIITNLNIDMIGRNDKEHKEDNNYLYLIGSGMLSKELNQISAAVNEKYSNINLDYRFDNLKDKNAFYYGSDHYQFAKNNIPVIFYFNGVHKDYHKPTDTADKINYPLYTKRVRLIFATAWEIANRKNKPKLDRQN